MKVLSRALSMVTLATFTAGAVVACGDEGTSGQKLKFIYGDQEHEVVPIDTEMLGSQVTLEGTVDGEAFTLVGAVNGPVARIDVRAGDREVWLLLDESGELRYGFSNAFADDNSYAVISGSGDELAGDYEGLEMVLVGNQETEPRKDLDEAGVGVLIAMLPTVIKYLEGQGLGGELNAGMHRVTGHAFAALFFSSGGSQWQGGHINGCTSQCDSTNCSCQQVNCLAGTYPSGTNVCTCIKVGWGPFSGSIGQCTCPASCVPCES